MIDITERLRSIQGVLAHGGNVPARHTEAVLGEAVEVIDELRRGLAEWAKLRDPVNLHANLLRGIPAKLTKEQVWHLAADDRDRLAELEAEAESLRDAYITLQADIAEVIPQTEDGRANDPIMLRVLAFVAEAEALRADAERYRWLRDKNSHHLHNNAWLASVTAVKFECDIFSAAEVPAMLDAEIDRRMGRNKASFAAAIDSARSAKE